MKNKHQFQSLLLEREQDLARVILNRPELHNAFDETMISELTQAFTMLAKDREVRIVVITGAGASFCAGGDLNWMKRMAAFTPKQNVADAKKLHAMLLAVHRCPKPVLAYVNGAALGGGAGLVSAVDIVFAEEKAVFGFTEVRVGLIPAVISPFVIRKIGEGNAREYFLTAERFSAATAKGMGLVQYAGPAELLEKTLDEKIDMLRKGSPNALAACKSLIDQVSGLPLNKAGTLTAPAIAKSRASQDGQEGIAAFFGKRKPKWCL